MHRSPELRATRRKPLRRKNASRIRERRERQFGEGELERQLVEMLPCSACGAAPPSEPSHAGHTRGAGGGVEDLVPHCAACHRKFHEWGVETFGLRTGQDVAADAARYAFLVGCLLRGGALDERRVAVDVILSTLRFGCRRD